jgi:ubiquinone/menaquinone biosynthesis C-methylase UbiE
LKGRAVIVAVSDEKFHVWDAYWHDNRIQSIGASADPQLLATLEKYWAGVVLRLTPGTAILDIACGNGAVGLTMARTAQAMSGALAITAIDEAMIDPPRYVPEHAGILSGIDFRPRTRMEALPFENATFDAVVSQYGFEFGNTTKALDEAARVLKPNGLLTFLALPAHSPAVQSAKKAVKQARYLLRDAALFDETFRILQAFYEEPLESREQKIRTDLERFNAEVEKAVAQFDAGEIDVVFAIIMGLNKIFVDRKSATAEAQMMAIETVRTGLAQYAARAQVTAKAALTDSTLESVKRAITAAGFKLTETRSLFVGGHGTVAWQLTGERLA